MLRSDQLTQLETYLLLSCKAKPLSRLLRLLKPQAEILYTEKSLRHFQAMYSKLCTVILKEHTFFY